MAALANQTIITGAGGQIVTTIWESFQNPEAILHKAFSLPDTILLNWFSCWLYYYVFIHVLYYVGSKVMCGLCRFIPDLAANKITDKLVIEQIGLSEVAFPLYCCVPTFGAMMQKLGVSRVVPTVAACGGWHVAIFNWCVYMFLVEGGVFFIHYWMLHVWPFGKKYMKHSVHHAYKEQEEMSAWSGYAFEAVDGFAQGMPMILGQLIIPLPWSFAIFTAVSVGLWTLYIHIGVPHLPWPMMGADYHYLHHAYNWYNFGLFTQLWDGIYGTLRHPEDEWSHKEHTAPCKITYQAKQFAEGHTYGFAAGKQE